MQPITVALGLTVTVLALTALLAGPQFVYLAPHTRVLLSQYWPALTVYGTLACVDPHRGDLRDRTRGRTRGPRAQGRSRRTVDPARRGRRSGAGRTDAAAGPGRF